MIVPKFSLRSALIVITALCCVFLIVSLAGRGHQWAIAVSIAAGAQIDGRLARREALGLDGNADEELLIVTPKASRPRKAASSTDLFPREEDKSALIVD